MSNPTKHRRHGIFCLEGDWWHDFNRTSTVKPVLKLLSQGVDHSIPTVHRDVGTFEELAYYLKRWSHKGMAKYPILYLAFHGDPGCIYVGDQRKKTAVVSLDDLAEILGSGLKNRIVHFGSCGTMDSDHRNIQRFLRTTGLTAATGFKNEIDWLASSVFDVLLFEAMLRQTTDRRGAKAVARTMKSEHKAMSRKLDFRMVIRTD